MSPASLWPTETCAAASPRSVHQLDDACFLCSVVNCLNCSTDLQGLDWGLINYLAWTMDHLPEHDMATITDVLH